MQKVKFYLILVIIIIIFIFIKISYNSLEASSKEKEHLKRCEYINKNGYKIVNISDTVFQEKNITMPRTIKFYQLIKVASSFF